MNTLKTSHNLKTCLKYRHDTGHCPDGSPGADAPVPPNYIYHPATQKHYRPGFEEVNWEEAQTRCNSEGGTLMELRKEGEHEAFEMMNSKLVYLTQSTPLH